MHRKIFGKDFWKLFSFVSKCNPHQKEQSRQFTEEKPIDYTHGTAEYKSLRAAIKDFSANLTHIPIRVGELSFGMGDVQYQYMPHNTRCVISQMSKGNFRILEHCMRNAAEMREEWSAVPIKDRIEICLKCAEILATESRPTLNASIMLGQSKTYRQAEEDTCRTINNLRNCAELLTKLSENCEFPPDKKGYMMRPSEGFVASMTPYNWTSQAVTLALYPALMGNCVIWVPSQLNVLSSYQIFLALQKADLPMGVISFVPMNSAFFLQQITKSENLVGLNFAGSLEEFRFLANSISKYMDRPFSFSHLTGPGNNKNFHFVHESADVEQVAAATVLAAFDYNGQRGNSCENLYVPKSLWSELECKLLEEMEKLKVGDVRDEESTITAVIHRQEYNRLVKLLKCAETSDNCDIIYGGNYKHTAGNFIEPSVVVCKTLDEPLMTRQVEGPILSVFVYENDQLDDILKRIASGSHYTISGSIFADSDDTACELAEQLRIAAANIYFNKPCIGELDGHPDEMPDFNHELIADKESLLKYW